MNTCLLLIDLQNDYFVGGKMELTNTSEAAAHARQLLDSFRQKKRPVIHIQHISARADATFFLPGTPGVEINQMVTPEQGESVVQKHYPNSFRDTELLDILSARDIDTLVICGAMSHMCIDATTRAAFDYGFSCIVAEDACATRNLLFNGETIEAAVVHGAFMAALSVPYAQILSSRNTIATLG